jgi:hypothetical protein
MATSILNAAPYDPKRDRRKKLIITAIVAVLLISAALVYQFRYWPQEHVVSKFFHALEAKDYATAYGIWLADPNWKQHPQAHARYTFGEFYLDWGPGGEYGQINSYHIDASGAPRSGGSGIVVQVTVNERTKKAFIWVEKSDKSLTYSPFELR